MSQARHRNETDRGATGNVSQSGTFAYRKQIRNYPNRGLASIVTKVSASPEVSRHVRQRRA
jgi:hypothetical protein